MSTPADQPQLVRLRVAAEAVRLPPARVRRYVRAGLVRPAGLDGADVLFGEPELRRLRKIRRLRHDLGINQAGVEVVLRLLDQIDTLRSQLSDRPGTGR